MEQVCRALDAAHSVGVIHRDLKPQNIMQDGSGRVLVMDFGLARTLEGDGMTQTGALVGTMEYMSPEQALAKELDQRSDIFSAGTDLLRTAHRPDAVPGRQRAGEPDPPYPGTRQAHFRARRSVPAKPQQHRQQVSGTRARQSLPVVQEFLAIWRPGRVSAPPEPSPSNSVKPWGQTVPWQWIGGIAAILVLAVVGFLFRDKLRSATKLPSAGAKPEVALAILPFRNASQDPRLDWYGTTLADMLSSDVGQSAHLRMVSPDRLHQVLHDLRIGADTVVDPTILRRVGDSSNADTVIWGQYAKFGDQIRIDANIQNLTSGKTTSLKAETSEKGLPAAIDTLADSIRKNLALSSDLIKELQAQSFKPSTTSVEALHDYTPGR